MKRLRTGVVLMALVCLACRARAGGSEDGKRKDATETVMLGEVRIGNEPTQFYIAYGPDEAILGFSVPDASGGTRYFPMYASTYRGMPAVVLDVFASKSNDAMWVRSSWPGSEVLAFHRVGADSAITSFGKAAFIKQPMPPFLSGGPIPFPEMKAESVSKRATFKHDGRDSKP